MISKQTFPHLSDSLLNQQKEEQIEKFEYLNKMNICKHFRQLNKDLDDYLKYPDRFKITYSNPITQPVKNGQTLVINNTLLNKAALVTKIYRRKCIVIDESVKTQASLVKQTQKSSIITCRNPFKMDENLFNYDMDTEDEWAEENGEDLNEQNLNMLSSDDEELRKEEEEEQQGWLVDDDYLSMSEMDMSNMSLKDDNQIQADLERRKLILQKNRESKQKQQQESEYSSGPQIFLFDTQNFDNSNEYAAINFISDLATPNQNFPIDLTQAKLKKQIDENDIDEDTKKGYDPNAINLKLVQLVRMIHGSLESKPKLIDDFNEQHPECSKNSIEKKIKEYFIKDKRGDDIRQRYYATEDILQQLTESFPGGISNLELVELAKLRLQPLLDEIRQAQQEIEEAREKNEKQKEREREELRLMRQEEQNQREFMKQNDKQIEKQQKEEKKAALKLHQEEEKKRVREQKQQQKIIELEEKLRLKQIQQEQKAKEKQLKKQEKEQLKEKLSAEKLDKKASVAQPQSEDIIKLLQKRPERPKSRTIIDQIDSLESHLENPSKKLKTTHQQDNNLVPSCSNQNINTPQKSGTLTNFFQKLPIGTKAQPIKIDVSNIQSKLQANQNSKTKNKTIKVQPFNNDSNSKVNSKSKAQEDNVAKLNVSKPKSVQKKKNAKDKKAKEDQTKPASDDKAKTTPLSKKQPRNLAQQKRISNPAPDKNMNSDQKVSSEKGKRCSSKKKQDIQNEDKPVKKQKSSSKAKKTGNEKTISETKDGQK